VESPEDGALPLPEGARVEAQPAAIRETHSAVVVFLGDRAYKVKKPVDLGFLDFSTRERREAVCHREVELNRRLAPDVYLGVADLVGPDGAVCDHLVVMRRMPDDRRLSTLIASGASVEPELRRIAHVIARFHEAAETPSAALEAASRDALAARWEANTETLERFAGPVLDGEVVARVALLARRYLAGRNPVFAHRITSGCARDGHGDLLADDIFCLDDGPRVLDCIEFDDALRFGDVLADVAFLAMDLERLGRPDLAALFLAAYRELTADTWPVSLAHHHVAYRAGVRAKVACIRHGQAGGAVRDEARLLLDLARRHLEAGRVRLIVVGGLPATGKSTVAAGVADVLGAVHLRSDEMRKELAGLPAGARAVAAVGEGIYDARGTDATYSALLDRARLLLGMGESVVLDATFHEPRWRAAVTELAAEAVADLTALRCVAPVEVAAARAARRLQVGLDTSDAHEAVVRDMASTAVPWPEATTIDTNGAPDAAISAALSAVGPTWGNIPQGVSG
jgi:aminoglycoside phosphotransferase family enzyme/predicted kinase